VAFSLIPLVKGSNYIPKWLKLSMGMGSGNTKSPSFTIDVNPRPSGRGNIMICIRNLYSFVPLSHLTKSLIVFLLFDITINISIGAINAFNLSTYQTIQKEDL
jgi:hypothetical protein